MPEILETLWKLFVKVLLPNAIFWCIVSVAILISVFGMYIRARRNLRSAEYFLNIVRDVSKALSRNHEVVAFDESDDVIYTTHPQLYGDKEEFLQNLSTRVTASPNYQNFCKFFETGTPCHTTISGSGSGLHNQFKKWLATINTLDKQNSLIGESISVVTISDISKQFAEAEKNSANYEKLENFIDHFPFGIFYINNSGEILGANTTFANLLNAHKNELVGVNIGEFIEDFNSDNVQQKQVSVVIKPRLARSFPAILAKSSMGSTFSTTPWVIYKANSADIIRSHDAGITTDIFTSSPIPSVITTETGEIISLNPAFASMAQDKVIVEGSKVVQVGADICEFIKGEDCDFASHIKQALQHSSNTQQLELKFDGGAAIAKVCISRIEKNRLLIQIVDVTTQKGLEKQFLQSQKMQTVGLLVGGIAHDFNNLLTAMIGFCDLLLQRYTQDDPSYGDIMQIRQNASRAANLVKQLLAFSRQKTIKPTVVSVTEILIELSSLLRRLVGVDIDLQIVHGRNVWCIEIDENQLEQVIMNLVVNARDAIEGEGKIKIKTNNVYVEEALMCANGTAKPGDYVLIEISDTGKGIAQEDIPNIFDPFFSRKDDNIRHRAGTGTGLGLSTVYGIINQAGGFIDVESELGSGTTFKIYITKYTGSEKPAEMEEKTDMTGLGGSGTILLVEDEEPVRVFSARALREKGYKVIEASCGDEALEILNDEKIDLLITDVIMPKMDGPTLSKMIKDKLPGVKTLFISGYTADTFKQDVSKNSDIHFLQKPFSLRDLAVKVKEVLSGA